MHVCCSDSFAFLYLSSVLRSDHDSLFFLLYGKWKGSDLWYSGEGFGKFQ